MDSILDAALDELACSSDSDDEVDVGPSSDTHNKDVDTKVDEATRASAAKQTFGPAPPPPTTPFAIPNLSSEEAELAASLEGMMQQFMKLDDANNGMQQDAEKAMEEMFQKMMGGMMMPDGGADHAASFPAGASGGAAIGKEERSKKANPKRAEKSAKSEGKKSSSIKHKKQSKGMDLT